MADDKHDKGDDGNDVWDSWEDMVDSGGLDKRLEKEELTLQEIRKTEESHRTQPIVLEEDTHRTKYQPQLKLMRRQNELDEIQETDASQNKIMTKSLAEREEEYAQARLRILGSPKNKEDLHRSKEPTKPPTNPSKKQKKKSATTSKKGSTAKR